ncbi:hypothetical protein COP2_026556 [Malus domestica]
MNLCSEPWALLSRGPYNQSPIKSVQDHCCLNTQPGPTRPTHPYAPSDLTKLSSPTRSNRIEDSELSLF